MGPILTYGRKQVTQELQTLRTIKVLKEITGILQEKHRKILNKITGKSRRD